jgi:hypothetical protein
MSDFTLVAVGADDMGFARTLAGKLVTYWREGFGLQSTGYVTLAWLTVTFR